MKRAAAVGTGLILIILTAGSLDAGQYEKILAEIERKTGLKAAELPGTSGAYLGKTHRGYQVIYTAKAGNVWGRYAARLTAAEIGREVGGILGQMTGQREALHSQVTGSPFDRLLSEIIGQPLSVTIILDHQKPDAPRLDIVSGYAKVRPEETLPEQARIGHKAGSIHSSDAAFASRLSGNAALMKRLKKLRGEYVRVDQKTVTFLWAGSETDYSGMIMDHGGYYNMVNALLDDLADIADAIPPAG